MSELTYIIKTPELLDRLSLKAIDLIRLCNVAIGTAYAATDPNRASGLSLETAINIYNGLRKHGYQVNWSDVVEFRENGRQ